MDFFNNSYRREAPEGLAHNSKINLKEYIYYIMPGVLKYFTDIERRNAFKVQQNNYSKKRYNCDVCNCFLNQGNLTKHNRSLKHQNNLNIVVVSEA